MNRALVFAVLFIIAYFVFVFSFMSRFDVNQPLPVWIRWVPLSCIVLAMLVVAMLSRRPKESARTRSGTVTRRVLWPAKVMTVLYISTLLSTIGGLAIGWIPMRLAIPGVIVNIALIALFIWLGRPSKTPVSR